MALRLLVLLGLAVNGQIQQIISTGQWFRNISASKSGISAEYLQCPTFGVASWFWFSSVGVPPGAVIQNATLTLLMPQNMTATSSIENADNSAPLSDCTQVSARSTMTGNSITGVGYKEVSVTQLVAQIVSRAGWSFGNAMMLGARTGTLSPGVGSEATLRVNFTIASPLTLTHATSIVPLSGNWSTGLNVAATTSNLSVGVANVVFQPPLFSIVPVSVSITGSISLVLGLKWECMNPPTVLTTPLAATQYVCQVPCAPTGSYAFTLKYCWSVPTTTQVVGNLTLVHQLLPLSGCSSDAITGTITFPSPVFLAGTLLPDDGRPPPAGGGQLTSNATLQPLNSRDLFSAFVGVQHFCPGPWVTLSLQSALVQIPCTVQAGRPIAPPPGAADDYYTLQFVAPACNATQCPGQDPMQLVMNYGSFGVFRTRDTLVYPTLPVIVAVSGCVDVLAATTQCPTSGGVRIIITMLQPVGYAGISVLVNTPCTSISTSGNSISCTLPSGIGVLQPLVVFLNGFVSAPAYSISYGAPTITTMTGGLGCVQDLGNSSRSGVKQCNRNGSTAVPLTIIGTNFGDFDVVPTLTLQGPGEIPVIKQGSPHTTLLFFLPPGFGSQLLLTLTVGSQSVTTYVSYESCALGQDAACVPCAAGRYGIPTPACVSCPAGKSQPLTGQSECVLCAKGTYQPATEQPSCVRCPDKMTTFGLGTQDSSLCTSCPVSYYLALDGADRVCAPCAPNSIPLPGDSCGCMSGFFDDRLNLTGDGASLNCRPCPPGANCQETGTRSASMGPLPGWWKSPAGTFVQCLDAVNCLGVQWGAELAGNSSSSMCLEHRGGVLCAECDAGYQPSSLKGGACIPCDNSALAWLWVSLVAVLVVLVSLGIGFCIHQRRQTRKVRLQQPTTTGGGAVAAAGAVSKDDSNLQLSTSHSSSSASISADWPTRSSRMDSLGPTAAAPVKKRKRDANTLISTGKIAVGFLQILSSMVAMNVALPSTFMQVMRVFAFLNFDFMPWASIRCVFHIDFYTRIYVGCLYPFVIVLLLIVCVAIPIALRNKRDYQDEELFREHRSQYVNKAITLVLFCIFLLYPWITLQLLQFGICLHLDGKYYLIADMTQLCFEGEWMSHLGSVITLFLLLSVGIPISLGILLYRSRFRLRASQVRARLGFLYVAYASECWWFEMVEMSTRVCLISIVRFFDPKVQAPLRMGVCFVYLVVVLLKKPYVQESLDALSLFCMTEVMLVSCLAHLLPAAGQWQGTYIDDLLSAVLLAIAFALFLFFLLQMVKATRWLAYHPAVRKFLLRKNNNTSRLRVATQFGSMFDENESAIANSESSLSQAVETSQAVPHKPTKPRRDPTVREKSLRE